MSSPSPLKPAYAKPWLSYAQQVEKLKSFGLLIPDERAAKTFLSHVNYYRFSGYCLAFETARHVFQAGTTFDDICRSYQFDQELRDLLTEALEVIEIDFRTRIAYLFGERHGAFGHIDPQNFFAQFDHADWIRRVHEETERSSELFVVHCRDNYRDYPNLAIWMLMEIMSFGMVTRMFRGMTRDDQKAISNHYTVQPATFGTIMLHFQYVRNLCAHHARVWDKVWNVKATLPHGQHWQAPLVPGNDRLFSTVLLLHWFLKRCPTMEGFAKAWRTRLHGLLDQPPNVTSALAKMGMPEKWKQNPIWG